MLRRNNRIAVRRGGRKLTRSCRALDLSSVRDSLIFLFGKPTEWYGSGWKLGRRCSKGECLDGSIFSSCRTYYTFEGEGPKGGVMLLKHCREYNSDTKKEYQEKDPKGPKEYF